MKEQKKKLKSKLLSFPPSRFKFLDFVTLGSFVLVNMGLVMEVVKYPGFLKRYLFIDSRLLLLVFLVWAIIYALSFKRSLMMKYWVILSLILPFLVGGTVYFTIKEFYTFPNYVLTTFSIHYQPLLYLSFGWLLVLSVFSPEKIQKKIGKWIIFFSPAVLLLYAVLMRMWTETPFFEYLKEDHVAEYIQFGLLVVCFLLGVLITRVLIKMKISPIFIFVYCCMTLGFFVLAGEEISWGQRIFNIELSQFLANQNTQQELTAHNNNFISQFIGQAYLFVGLYGTVSWVLVLLSKKLIMNRFSNLLLKRIYSFSYLFTPPWFSSLFFFSLFRFNYLMQYQDGHYFLWGEFFELLLIFGFFVFMMNSFVKIRIDRGREA